MDLFKQKKPMIVIVTQDWSGAGWANLCIKAGYPCIVATKMKEDDEHEEEFNLVGDGIFPKIELDKLMKERNNFKNAYFIWDFNHNFEESEILRKEGFKVWGGSEFTYKLEKDRNFGVEIVKKAGLETPPTFEFKTKEEGMKFLDENEDLAYVFKPDEGDGCFTTYVPDATKPDKANRELYDYLDSQEGETGYYVLQERKDGLEINIEYWVYKGKPFLCHANFESKRKLNHDEGEMVGCSQDIEFIVPINCKLAVDTIGKLLKLPEFKDYTGPVDMNVIICEKKYYFLEFCCRMGYSATPNLIMNLCMIPFPDLMTRWIDGKVEGIAENFKEGFGASVNLYIDHKKSNLPIFLPEDTKFYMYDLQKKENKFFLCGYAQEVGIILSHDYTIKRAAEKCLKLVDTVNYPMHACRTDLDLENYESSPILRLEAAESMGLFI